MHFTAKERLTIIPTKETQSNQTHGFFPKIKFMIEKQMQTNAGAPKYHEQYFS